MKAKLYLTIKVTDRDGKVLRKFTRKAHSFLNAYNRLVHIQLQQAAESVTDTSGNSQSIGANALALAANAGAAVVLFGIRFGLSSAAVTIDDYALASPIAEGTSTNNLNHLEGTFTDPAVVGSVCSFTVVRSAINNTGTSITVTECGIYCKGGSVPRYFCIVRDVLASSVSVPDGGAITATYTIKVSV